MEQNDKGTLETEKQQMNGQTEEAPQETTTPEEPANVSENNSDKNDQEMHESNAEKNEEEISVNNGDQNEEENVKEEEEEEDELADGFQTSVEMSIRQFENDENNRPICRYNTVSYRKIKKGNTKQRIDEFESMLDV
ncbi:ermin-like [Cyprinus carpio]|uniref:Ermin-like n=1 Tax=Cyprinus carpio TaxID=7962 RepID=A0A9Q9Y498_CYPCA|nr:ermin-like [Cyprinus carpio]